MRKKNFHFLIGFCCMSVLFSCGYKFSGSGSLPEGVTGIYIEVLENRTSEISMENIFSNDLIGEFSRRDKSILKKRAVAEATLSGVITSISAATISHLDRTSSSQMRVQVNLHMKLISTKTGNILWERKNILETEAYDVDPTDRFATDQNKRAALLKISERSAEKVYKMLTDNF